jgi:hypothetical protein
MRQIRKLVKPKKIKPRRIHAPKKSIIRSRKPGVSVQQLWKMYHKLNKEYFHDSIWIHNIRIGKFLRDPLIGSMTWGLFNYREERRKDGDMEYVESVEAEIIINEYLLSPIITRAHPWLTEVILYHEMCHAMMALNTHSARHGKYTCDSHGPEFEKLMNRHPRGEEADILLRRYVFKQASKEAQRDASKYLDSKKGETVTVQMPIFKD